MDVHLIQAGAVGRKEELLSGMAGQRRDLFQRYLDEVRGFVRLADELGYAGYGHNEHHLQIEGFEATNHPGMFSQFIGNNSTRLRVNTLGYVAPTHNPVRAAEEIAMLDHILQGRLAVGFVRGYQDRWVANYAAVPGARATTPDNAKRKDEQDAINRAIFEESVRIVKKAWTEPTFSYEGEFWTFPPKDLVPAAPDLQRLWRRRRPRRPGQRRSASPPTPTRTPTRRSTGRSPTACGRSSSGPARAASRSCWPTTWTSPRCCGTPTRRRPRPPAGTCAREDIAAWGGLAGRQRGPRRPRAPDRAALVVLRRLVRPLRQARPMPIMGTPDEVTRIITDAHARLGFNELHLLIGQGYQEREVVEDNLRLFAEKVMPRLP